MSQVKSPPYDYLFKLLLFGDGGVGKTSLTRKFVTGLFSEDSKITIGVEFHAKDVVVDGAMVRLQVWDFGGEERFRFILPNYCRGAAGGIYMYDVTAPQTLNRIQEWLQIVRANAGSIPLLMVGTKADLGQGRKVQPSEAIDIAKNHKMSGFIEVSAKTGQNVETSFITITRLMMKHK